MVSVNDSSIVLVSWVTFEQNGSKIDLNLYYKTRTSDGTWFQEKLVTSSLLSWLQTQSLNNLNEGVLLFPVGSFNPRRLSKSNIFVSQTTETSPITKADQLWKISQTQSSFYPQKTGL